MKALVASFAAAAILTGCSVADPYGHADPPAPAAREAATAARSFATAWSNWSWRDLHASYRRRASLATGSLRSNLLNTSRAVARAVAREGAFHHQHLASHGTVLALATAPRGVYIVLRETVTTRGHAALGDGYVRVYRAAVALVGRRWLVSSWQVVE